MFEKKIFYVGLREFASKKDGKKYYQIDYVRMDSYIPKTDFISVLEYTTIKKKMGDKHFLEATAIFSLDDYDRLYLSDIK